MAQGYYTLPEAAKVLAMSVDELKAMAQKGQIRSFQDRGTLRFRIQDVQELARTRGAASDGDLALGDASLPAAKSGSTPKSGAKKAAPASSPKSPAKQTKAPEVFQFDIDEEEDDSVDLGADLLSGKGSSKGKPGSKVKKPVTPTGSDSDVRLVPDGNDISFSVPKKSTKTPDSDVKVPSDPMKPRSGSSPTTPASSGKRKSQLAVDSGTIPLAKAGDSKPPSPRGGQTPQPADSGVRLVPMDSDSDVKLVGASDEIDLGAGPSAASDSNVRLEKVSLPPADSHEGNMHLTEEINLDEEIQKQQEREKDKPSTKLKAKSELKMPPAGSPFELSDSDLELPSELKASKLGGPRTPKKAESKPSDSSDFELTAHKKDDTSSEFDLGNKDGSSDFDLTPAGSEEFNLEASGQEQVLQEEIPELTSSKSGISLQNPVDSGISLEDQPDLEGSDFDMSLEAADTPRPRKSAPAEDSSEFELTARGNTPRSKRSAPAESDDDIDLSLDADDDSQGGADKESSEFDLSLDASDEGPATDSDSEFELTLDDSSEMQLEEDERPQVKSKKKGGDDEQDIFDTDFEVPALDESDDATVADSELESSDFDIALDDSDLSSEDESGSQVVALDEESDADTVADDDAAVVDDIEVEEESSDFADLDQDVEVEEEDVEVEVEGAKTRVKTRTVTVVEEKLIPAADWGILPVIFMFPCVIIMFLVGVMGFEAVQTSAGIRPPGTLTSAVAKMIDADAVSLKK
jgi:hypothetical protein